LGAGSGSTILDAGGIRAGILVTGGSAGERINIGGLTVRNTELGSAYAGFDIQSPAIVHLSDVNVQNSIRYGIWNRGTGRLELLYSNVTNTLDEDPRAFIVNGTGILNDGEMNILGSTIANNAHSGIINHGRLFISSSFIQNNQVDGIRQDSPMELNLTDVTLANNALAGFGTAMVINQGETNVTRGMITDHADSAIFVRSSLNMDGTIMTMNDGQVLGIYAEAVVSLNNITVTNNGALGGYQIVWNEGDLTITNSRLNNNNKTLLYNSDMGVINISDTEFRSNNLASVNLPVIFNGDRARMTLNRVLVVLNRTADRAAVESFGTATLTNVTFSGNRSFYAVRGLGNFNLSYSTIADNFNYGILADSALSTTISNVLFARNAAGDCQYTLTSSAGVTLSGFNIDTDGSCGVSATYSPTAILLGPLADNGGFTQTHELLISPTISPAIDTATGTCPADDQRGVARPAGASCDVGAFEAGIALLPLESGAETTPTPEMPILIVTTDSGCFAGPGLDWPRYSNLSAGTQAEVVGQGLGGGWLVIKHPTIINTNCWIDQRDVEFDFPLDQLRLIAIPPKPTSTSSPENEPRETAVPTVCFYNQQTQQTICQ
jgi:hypothetical protein